MVPISITGIGSYLPRRMLSNDDLTLDKPVTEEQLAKLGVTSRGWAGEGESIPEMAAAAGLRAMERAGITADELDLIVLANWTQRRFIPDFAPKLQALLGAPQAFAFDVSTACAGFAFGAGVAQGFLQNPRHRRCLLVASETTSSRARPHSKATLVFGDAAGAWILERGEVEGAGRLIDLELMTDGTKFDAMGVNEEGHVYTSIDQKSLQQLAIHSFRTATEAVLTRNGLTLDDLDWIVPHSGTAGIQALLLRTLEVDPAKVLINFPRIGNVSSAAIPASLDEFVSRGVVKPGDLVLSPTTGTGWYAAAMLYRV